jgi:uncharacterized protein YlzI (FlbEa/FlbD family)
VIARAARIGCRYEDRRAHLIARNQEGRAMISLHRLGHPEDQFQLNPDLIVSIESTPDTVITLATSAKVVVDESPEEVADAVRGWRVQVLAAALRDRTLEQEGATAATRGAEPPVRARRAEPVRALSGHRGLAAIDGGGH